MQHLAGFAHRQEIGNAPSKLLRRKRLEQIILSAPPKQIKAKLIVRLGGQKKHRNVIKIGLAAQLGEELFTVHPGHHQIAENDVRLQLLRFLKALAPIESRCHPVLGRKRIDNEAVHFRIIFDD